MGEDEHIYTLMHILGADCAIDSPHEGSFKILDHTTSNPAGLDDGPVDQSALETWLSTRPVITHSGVHFEVFLPILNLST